MADDSDLAKGMHDMSAKIGELVIEIRHSNERFDESQKRTEKAIDDIEKENKLLHKDLIDIQKRLPLVEKMSERVESISSKLIGAILLVVIMGALAASFAAKAV